MTLNKLKLSLWSSVIIQTIAATTWSSSSKVKFVLDFEVCHPRCVYMN